MTRTSLRTEGRAESSNTERTERVLRNENDEVYVAQENKLDVPAAIKQAFKNKGFVLSWVRYTQAGGEDIANIRDRLHDKTEFVRRDELGDFANELESFKTDKFGDILVVGDLALAKTPTVAHQRRREYFQNKDFNNLSDINRRLAEASTDRHTPVFDNRNSVTRTGKGATKFQD